MISTALFLQFGFDVYESPHHLIVTSPQTFASGDPACFWVKKDHHQIIFNDYGSTLNALELSLPNPDGALEILKSQLKRIHSEIQLDGVALVRECTEQQMNIAISDYLNLFAVLTTYQPKSHNEQQIHLILDKIYHYLFQHFGQVECKVSYKGLSGQEHKFSFQSKNKIFEFAKPNAKSTGGLLRKILDVQETYQHLDFNIVLDDSNQKLFETESRILSTHANVKPLSLVA